MHRSPLLPLGLVAAAAMLLTPHSGSAQMYYYSFGNVPAFGSSYSFTPRAPRAQHDSRMDPHLLRAARLAEDHAAPRSTLRCWKYVKNALVESGAVDGYPATNYACQAGTELVNHYGFVRLPIHNPYNAPVGSVIVYGDGGAGHVELRTEHGFASDYRSTYRCRYSVIGVYAKI